MSSISEQVVITGQNYTSTILFDLNLNLLNFQKDEQTESALHQYDLLYHGATKI